MKRNLALGVTALLATTLVACTGGGGNDPVAAVYGPAPTDVYATDAPVDDVYGSPVMPYDDDEPEDGYDHGADSGDLDDVDDATDDGDDT